MPQRLSGAYNDAGLGGAAPRAGARPGLGPQGLRLQKPRLPAITFGTHTFTFQPKKSPLNHYSDFCKHYLPIGRRHHKSALEKEWYAHSLASHDRRLLIQPNKLLYQVERKSNLPSNHSLGTLEDLNRRLGVRNSL